MTPKEILIKARDLISSKNTWTTDASARDVLGRRVDPCGPAAVCFCATGALAKASQSTGLWSETVNVLAHASLELFDRTPVYVNDRIGHEATILMFSRAIELAE